MLRLVYLCLLAFFSQHALTLDVDLPSLTSLNTDPALHFVIKRRGGSYESLAPDTEAANLSQLLNDLHRIEQRYSLTHRAVNGNKLVRTAKSQAAGGEDATTLMSEVQRNGIWFTTVNMGTPPQPIELDLDMLTSDFYVLTTTSREGSKYDDLFSSTIEKSSERPFPACTLPTESFLLPSSPKPVNLKFAYCRPPKSSSRTLASSGSMIGLAASDKMAQIGSPSIVSQLKSQDVITQPIFSIMLINGYEGVLSVGGSGHAAVEAADTHTKAVLDKLGAAAKFDETEELTLRKRQTEQAELPSLEDAFRWTNVQGAEGWWQVLMKGVWVDERKILKNQPVVVDINTPLVIAPPASAAIFYSSIPGAYPLPGPHPGIYAFPCLNPPSLAFEFGGWNFPTFRGGKRPDSLGRDGWGRPGGRLSLGRIGNGSGYCIGSVVGLDLSASGASDQDSTTSGDAGTHAMFNRRARAGTMRKNAEVDGNGMRGVWVLGEPWLRGVSAVFDLKGQRVGFRST